MRDQKQGLIAFSMRQQFVFWASCGCYLRALVLSIPLIYLICGPLDMAYLRAHDPSLSAVDHRLWNLASMTEMETGPSCPTQISLFTAVTHHVMNINLGGRIFAFYPSIRKPGNSFLHSEWRFSSSLFLSRPFLVCRFPIIEEGRLKDWVWICAVADMEERVQDKIKKGRKKPRGSGSRPRRRWLVDWVGKIAFFDF